MFDQLAFQAALADFDATGNPVFAVRTFMLATKMGVYPPQRIMQWVSQAFQKWDNDEGELSMDKAMNLVQARGKTAVHPAALLRDRDAEAMWEMDLLIALGASRKQAAEMVESRLEQEDWNKSRHELSDLKTDTLIKMHAARRENHWADQESLDELMQDPDWRDWLRARLRTYNPLYVPPALKSML